MRIYISVISHGHAELIKKIDALPALAKENIVVLKCNRPEDFPALSSYCEMHGIFLLAENYGLGFGENNNYIFKHCRNKLGLSENDYFIVMNPDVKIDNANLKKLQLNLENDNANLAAINLYKNEEKTISDDSIRRFPRFIDFINSYLFKKNTTKYNKKIIKEPMCVDWAAGSFLVFKSKHYAALNGFDKRYFMYCEDIDICYRSNKIKSPVIYYPDVIAIHFAKHANRAIISKHFYWHLKSVATFMIRRYFKI